MYVYVYVCMYVNVCQREREKERERERERKREIDRERVRPLASSIAVRTLEGLSHLLRSVMPSRIIPMISITPTAPARPIRGTYTSVSPPVISPAISV